MVWVAEEEGGQTEAEVEVGGGEGAVVVLPLVSQGERLACGMPPDQEEGRRKEKEKSSEPWLIAFILQATPFTERRRVPLVTLLHDAAIIKLLSRPGQCILHSLSWSGMFSGW